MNAVRLLFNANENKVILIGWLESKNLYPVVHFICLKAFDSVCSLSVLFFQFSLPRYIGDTSVFCNYLTFPVEFTVSTGAYYPEQIQDTKVHRREFSFRNKALVPHIKCKSAFSCAS